MYDTSLKSLSQNLAHLSTDIDLLITRGADTYAAEGTTPLHDAVANEQHDIAEILLQKGGKYKPGSPVKSSYKSKVKSSPQVKVSDDL